MKRLGFCFFIISLFFVACSDTENASGTAGAKQHGNADEQKVVGYQIGDIAQDFSLKGIDDEMVSMDDFPEAKGFIIVFTCNTCPYAVEYEDRIMALDEKLSASGYQLIAINPNDPEVKKGDSMEAMKERAEEKGFDFPYLLDEGQQVYPLFGATKTPHVFVLDSARKIQYIGAIDDNHQDAAEVKEKYVEQAIAAIESGQKPNPATTKAIGCTIKVKS